MHPRYFALVSGLLIGYQPYRSLYERYVPYSDFSRLRLTPATEVAAVCCMGDSHKQSGDSDYCDSEYAPSLVNFHFLLPDDDEEDQEEQLSPASSIACWSEQHDAIRNAAAAEWESEQAEHALRASIALGETPSTPGSSSGAASSSYTKAEVTAHPKWAPSPPYPVPEARVRHVTRRGKVLPPVPPFNTARQVDKDFQKDLSSISELQEGI